jgi:hypothetical protein
MTTPHVLDGLCVPRRPKWHYCWTIPSRHNRNSNSLRNRIWRGQVARDRSGRSAYPGWVIDIAAIKAPFEALEPVLDERERRLFAASEARAAGHGGVVAV